MCICVWGRGERDKQKRHLFAHAHSDLVCGHATERREQVRERFRPRTCSRLSVVSRTPSSTCQEMSGSGRKRKEEKQDEEGKSDLESGEYIKRDARSLLDARST